MENWRVRWGNGCVQKHGSNRRHSPASSWCLLELVTAPLGSGLMLCGCEGPGPTNADVCQGHLWLAMLQSIVLGSHHSLTDIHIPRGGR